MGNGAPPPGWYEDPQDPQRHRWWDGERWTETVRPNAGSNLGVGMHAASGSGSGVAHSAPVARDTGAASTVVPGQRRHWQVIAGVAAALILLGGGTALGMWLTGDGSDDEPIASDTVAGDEGPASDPEPVEEPEPVEQPEPPPIDDTIEEEPDGFDAPPTRGTPGPLELGVMLPQTGMLAFLEPGIAAGVELAVVEVDAGGGVLGERIRGTGIDDGGEESIAVGNARQLITDGVQAVVGPTGSRVTTAVAPLFADSPVVQCSSTATSPELSGDRFDGFLLRTVPSDAVQTDALAQLLATDGADRVAVIYRSDDYGRAMNDSLRGNLDRRGIGVDREDVAADDGLDESTLDSIAGSAVDGVVLLTWDESASIIDGLVTRGVPPTQLYIGDGGAFAIPGQLGDPAAAQGVTVVEPFEPDVASLASDLRDGLSDGDVRFAAATYDCVMLLALAAEAAGSTDPTDIRNHLPFVTGGSRPCDGFEACAAHLREGITVDYQSRLGTPLVLNERNQPRQALIQVRRLVGDELVEQDTILADDLP